MKMMKYTLLAVTLFVGCWICVCWGLMRAGADSALGEAKILKSFIGHHREDLDPKDPFRQYVLARYYLNVSRLDPELRKSMFEDFGPPEPKTLSGLPLDKSPVFDIAEVYSELKKEQSNGG